MQVFISWSGNRSKAVAEALQEWFRRVIQAVDPWISSEMTKGLRWSPEIAARLEESKIGVICLTSDNLKAPWILFEAGAMSKTKDAFVCTFLLDVAAADVEQPLGQFQHTLANEADMRRLVHTINTAVGAAGGKALPQKDLDVVFNTFWPSLKSRLEEVAADGEPEQSESRTDRELLEEMLTILRTQDRRARRASIVERFGVRANGRVYKTGQSVGVYRDDAGRLVTITSDDSAIDEMAKPDTAPPALARDAGEGNGQ